MITSALRFWLTWSLLLPWAAAAAEPWQAALAKMPLPPGLQHLDQTNCVDAMLGAFQSNSSVKALIFMPGATDEFYMFHRARADLTNEFPTLLDAVRALTNQTLIRATFRPPLLLLHSDEDPLEPIGQIEDLTMATRLKQARFLDHALYLDRDWDFVQPILRKRLRADVRPWRFSYDSWHFYRHSFAGWNLSGWEALEAFAMAGKTRFTVGRTSGLILRRPRIIFEGDTRVRATPKVAPPLH